ncbi:putative ribonuclease H-like domain-containing protein [Tanacetum coccineum]
MNYEPISAGNQTNDNAGIETNVNAVQTRQDKASNHEYILLPFLTSDSQGSKSSDDKFVDDVGKKNDAYPSISAARQSFDNNDLPTDPLMPKLEDSTGIFRGAYDDEDVGAEDDLNNLETTMNVWTSVDLPKGKIAIGTKWVYRNNKDERGIIVRNKARLVAQAYASFMGFIVYQIDVKSAFLYGTIEEEVHVCQPPSFEDPQFPNKVYKVEKALYGLHQAPRAWYETLSTYLIENGFKRGTIDKTLLIKKDKGDILLVQVYVDDIIFRSTKKSLCDEFEQMMHKKFQISSTGELTFFLGLQVQQKKDGIFISQDKYVVDILKKFDFITIKTTSTPMEPIKALVKDEEADSVDVHLYRSMIGSLIYLKGQPKLGLWYLRDSPFDVEAFSNSDYAGASLDKKSITGAEYVATANCYGQVLWIQNQILDYGFNFTNTKIYIDNESTICVVKNLVFHSKTKHIEIRHHFIRDSYEKKLIQVIMIHTNHNVADLLTKAFDISSVNAGDFVNTTDVSHVGFHHITNGHQFTMSNRQERIGYSRANGDWYGYINNHKKIHQKRANTNTRNGRAQKKPEMQSQSQEKSKSQSCGQPPVNLGQQKSTHKRTKPQKLPL